MERNELYKRIQELCTLVQRETDREKLLGLFRELDALISEYREEAAKPQLSNYLAEVTRLNYEPTEEDIKWARQLTNSINHRGTAVFPASRLIYRVDHHQRTMTLQNPEQLEVFSSFVTHAQTVAVFERIGYTVNELERSPEDDT